MRIRKEYRRQAYVIECSLLLSLNTTEVLIPNAFCCMIVRMQKRQLQGNAVFKSLTANNRAMHHQRRLLTASQSRCINDPNMNGIFFQHMLRMMMHTLANGKQPYLRNSSSSMPQAFHHLLHPSPVQLHRLISFLRATIMHRLWCFIPPVVGEVNYRHWKQSWMTILACWFMIGLYHLRLYPSLINATCLVTLYCKYCMLKLVNDIDAPFNSFGAITMNEIWMHKDPFTICKLSAQTL